PVENIRYKGMAGTINVGEEIQGGGNGVQVGASTYTRPRCEMTQSNDFSERRFGEMKTVLHDLRSNRSIERLPKGSQNCAGLFRIEELALVCLASRKGRKRDVLEANVERTQM